MPPKKAAKKINIVQDTKEAPVLELDPPEQAVDIDEDIDEEYIVPQSKERYEYNPIQQTNIVYMHRNNRVTSEIMSLYEFTECVAQRAKQLENDSRVRFTDTSNTTDFIAMAKKELADRKCPLAVRRLLYDNIYEIWRTSEMVIPWL